MTSLNLISFLGLCVFFALAYLFSVHKKSVSFALIIKGFILQWVLAFCLLGIPALSIEGPLRFLFSTANSFVIGLLSFTEKGSRFVFGDLLDSDKYGFILAFQVLPTIIFMSTLMAVLYHLGLMQKVINTLARLMQKTINTSGAESLAAAANIFVGQTEAPLVIRPFLSKMTRSEIFCIMVGGMATVAGGVMAAYVGLLKTAIPDIAGHLLTASVLSAPAALVLAKIMYPETHTPETLGNVPTNYSKIKIDANVIEATARGASEGLKLSVNVAAMLIAFIALIALVDEGFRLLGVIIGFQNWGHAVVPSLLLKNSSPELSASLVAGWLFSPLAFLMGISWQECAVAGSLLGQKIILNEFVAYFHLSQMLNELSERTVIILSYALCGFANFSSIGIQIGGIGSLAPERKKDLAQLGLRAVIGGSLAAFVTACIAGVLIP